MPAKKTNKTKAIKTYMEKNPQAKPKQVSQALAKQGIKVSPQYVSTIKSLDKQRAPIDEEGAVSVTGVLAAKKFVEEVGGIDQARAALAALKLLQS